MEPAVAIGSPEQLAFGPDGKLYISSCENGRVVRVEGSDRLTVVAGRGGVGDSAGDGGPATKAQFGCAAGIAFDAAGDLYVVDHLGNRVRKVDREGIITTVVGGGPIGYNAGDLAGVGGPALAAHLNEPIGVGFDGMGRLYISDRDNDRLRRVNADGIITTVAGTSSGFAGDGGPANEAKLAQPYYFVLDRGAVYLCDNANGRVRKIARDGTISTLASKLEEPFGIALAPDHSLYVSAGNQVFRLGRSGHKTLVAGSGEIGFSGDGGPATQAALSGPAGLAVDEDGNLYVADSGNHRVRKVGLDGVIKTFAGP